MKHIFALILVGIITSFTLSAQQITIVSSNEPIAFSEGSPNTVFSEMRIREFNSDADTSYCIHLHLEYSKNLQMKGGKDYETFYRKEIRKYQKGIKNEPLYFKESCLVFAEYMRIKEAKLLLDAMDAIIKTTEDNKSKSVKIEMTYPLFVISYDKKTDRVEMDIRGKECSCSYSSFVAAKDCINKAIGQFKTEIL